jgi:hypothetical protein
VIRPKAYRGVLGCLLALLLGMWFQPVAWSQSSSRFEEGDEVIANFLGEWRPAKVIQAARNEVLAEVEFAGATQRRTFKIEDVRFPHEADAIYATRQWSDAGGMFRVKAALLALDDTTVTLRKPDMKEIQVPIDKLSERDQQFVKRLRKELGPIAPRGPQVTEFSTDLPAASYDERGNKPNALTPDPVPAYETLVQGGYAFPTAGIHDRLGAVLPLGGAGSLVLAAVESGLGDSPTRLLWANLEKQELEGQQLLPAGEVVFDYHPPTHRLLTFQNDRELGQVMQLTIWQLLPAAKTVVPVIRWQAPAKWVHEPWGRLVDGNIVLHRTDAQEYVGWDVTARRARYRINQESFFHPLPVLSGGRKQLYVCEDKQVRVYDAVTGQLLSTLPAPNGSSGVAITRDGRRAAVLNRNTLAVWDLTNPDSGPDEYQAEAIGTPFTANVDWVGNDRLMADNGIRGNILFGLKERMALWKYEFDSDAVRADSGRRLRAVVDGHLVYAASLRSGAQQGLAVGAVKLPGPKVEEAVAALDRESLLVMKAGSPVRLVVQVDPQYQAQVTAALQRKVAENQWTISPTAAAVLTATMSRGKTQTTTYRNFSTGAEQSATVTPFISSLILNVGDNVAWQSGTSSGLPPMMRLGPGQSAQAEAAKYQQPNPQFFEQVEIPQQVADPTKREGLGMTRVTTRGLEPLAAE